ncbi:unnamed protein product [Amoebophrya sp. A120]|nr:unnamed protein product [Amoebophrya sp. A120]|eukprot:GSA120T00024547001.1
MKFLNDGDVSFLDLEKLMFEGGVKKPGHLQKRRKVEMKISGTTPKNYSNTTSSSKAATGAASSSCNKFQNNNLGLSELPIGSSSCNKSNAENKRKSSCALDGPPQDVNKTDGALEGQDDETAQGNHRKSTSDHQKDNTVTSTAAGTPASDFFLHREQNRKVYDLTDPSALVQKGEKVGWLAVRADKREELETVSRKLSATSSFDNKDNVEQQQSLHVFNKSQSFDQEGNVNPHGVVTTAPPARASLGSTGSEQQNNNRHDAASSTPAAGASSTSDKNHDLGCQNVDDLSPTSRAVYEQRKKTEENMELTAVVSNVHRHATRDEVRNYFTEKCGKVADIRFVPGRGMFSIACIQFEDRQGIEKAIHGLADPMIKGYRVTIKSSVQIRQDLQKGKTRAEVLEKINFQNPVKSMLEGPNDPNIAARNRGFGIYNDTISFEEKRKWEQQRSWQEAYCYKQEYSSNPGLKPIGVNPPPPPVLGTSTMKNHSDKKSETDGEGNETVATLAEKERLKNLTNRIRITNLPANFDNKNKHKCLLEWFQRFGEMESVVDKTVKEHKFQDLLEITFKTVQAATDATECMNGFEYFGEMLKVMQAHKVPLVPPPGVVIGEDGGETNTNRGSCQFGTSTTTSTTGAGGSSGTGASVEVVGPPQVASTLSAAHLHTTGGPMSNPLLAGGIGGNPILNASSKHTAPPPAGGAPGSTSQGGTAGGAPRVYNNPVTGSVAQPYVNNPHNLPTVQYVNGRPVYNNNGRPVHASSGAVTGLHQFRPPVPLYNSAAGRANAHGGSSNSTSTSHLGQQQQELGGTSKTTGNHHAPQTYGQLNPNASNAPPRGGVGVPGRNPGVGFGMLNNSDQQQHQHHAANNNFRLPGQGPWTGEAGGIYCGWHQHGAGGGSSRFNPKGVFGYYGGAGGPLRSCSKGGASASDPDACHQHHHPYDRSPYHNNFGRLGMNANDLLPAGKGPLGGQQQTEINMTSKRKNNFHLNCSGFRPADDWDLLRQRKGGVLRYEDR